jgi:hypothetical protein
MAALLYGYDCAYHRKNALRNAAQTVAVRVVDFHFAE